MASDRGARWSTGLLVAAVVIVNLAGVVGIVLARRTALEESHRGFREDVEARARTVEGLLSEIRADLAFLAASSPVGHLDDATDDESIASGRRAGAESALLLFLRAHPEVVPVLWVSVNPTGLEGAALAPNRLRMTSTLDFDVDGRTDGGRFSLETEVEPAALLEHSQRGVEPGRVCDLLDAKGRRLARHPAHRSEEGETPAPAEMSRAGAVIRADEWAAPGPLRLECEEPEGLGGGRASALTARYRTTLSLNLGVMALTLLLGGFAVQQARRRARVEAKAHEEARVRELERRLFHAERLTTVGRLAAGIAHEINNPLSGVVGYSKLLLERDLDPKIREKVERIAQSGERCRKIVEGVLLFSRSQQGGERTEIDLATLVDRVVRIGEYQWKMHNVRIMREPERLPESASLRVMADGDQLEQVLLNLLSNAVDAMPRGGTVRITLAAEPDDHISFSVSDEGVGIPDAIRDSIFDPFFSTKEIGKGTGLGLSISYGIVRDHGGDILLESQPGRGTTFRVVLPRSGRAAKDAHRPPDPSS
jgi:signal transduction histidine kinase